MANPVRSAMTAVWTLVVGGAIGALGTSALVLPRLRRVLDALMVDDLTGLGNRRRLAQVADGTAAGTRPAWVAFCDLDGFKAVNDVLGHAAGDAVLRQVASVLRSSVRPGDVVCRVGGDEFVVVLWACSADEAGAVIERMRRRLAAVPVPVPTACTLSVGLAAAQRPGTMDAAMRSADRALLSAKASGRDQVVMAPV